MIDLKDSGINYLKVLAEIMTIEQISELLKKKGLSHLKGEQLQEAIGKEIDLIIEKNDD